MIAFISDLHISDRTCGTFHLPPRAFTGVFQDLATHARNEEQDHLHLVLLGDVFDLVHTEYWLSVPERHHPWGEAPSEKHAYRALEAVAEANQEVFGLFGEDIGQYFEGVPRVTATYLPGNHDRLCNAYPSLRQLTSETLGLARKDPAAPFPWHFLDRHHDVFARHGHQFDPWNYEEGPDFRANGPRSPIGDIITAMLLSKLPRLVKESLLLYHEWHPERIELAEVNRIAWDFKAMFDVRPLPALISWLFHQVEALSDPPVREIVEAAIAQTARDFREMPSVRRWMKRQPLNGLALEGLLWLMERVPLLYLRGCRGPLHHVVRYLRSPDAYRRAALRDMARYGVRYVVYGHTHHPLQIPLMAEGSGQARRETFYLNTGTWRPSFDETIDQRDFVGVKGLTYTIVYSPHRGSTRPRAAEAWTGMLKDHRI